MPVPVRDTPLGRELYEEGRQEGRQEGDRQAVLRLTRLMLCQPTRNQDQITKYGGRTWQVGEELSRKSPVRRRRLSPAVSG